MDTIIPIILESNIRLLDCINRPKALIDKAIELGLSGLAITDHEALSAHMEVNQYAKKLRETNPDFTIALGNEIYLTETRDKGQKYYHFILIAKDAIGHRALRELSSTAWYNSYEDRRLERVPTLKTELSKVVNKYKGHLIATSACLGGELGSEILALLDCRKVEDKANERIHYENIVSFLNYCKDLFGDDFYLECQPSNKSDQIAVNKKIRELSKCFNIKMTVGTDSHYLTEKDRPIHKAYLNSKGGEREVDDFYEFARLMSPEETRELLKCSDFDDNFIDGIFRNSLEIQNKITFYSLERKQIIPKVEVKDYPRANGIINPKYKILNELFASGNIQERYWANECINFLKDKNLVNDEYLSRLEIEADVIKYIGEKLDDCLFAYFNTFQHYIDLFWACGSLVGPGRGSATGFLSNYALGITQLDPIRWNLPYWRFLNRERAELPDIDVDLAPSKRPAIFEAIRKERGELGLVQVATFGSEGTKSAILTACRGYRSEDWPDGIDVDIAQYMSSLIPQERGFLWTIEDCVYGNEEKGRKPVQSFIKEVNKYPGLLDIIISIAGLINKRGIHASGVVLYGDDPFETASFMRAPNGDLITCYDLHKAEAAGDTKYDFLLTEVQDKIIRCLDLLQEDGAIEKMSLRDTYNKYIHPEVIDTTDKRIWEHLATGDVLDVFQFNTGVGLAIAKRLKPKDPIEMTCANAMMRLMSEKGKESQQDRYSRIQRQGIEVFDKEMRNHGLTEGQIQLMHHHCDKYYGCCAIQEQMMEILMDVANFTLAEANDARKIVGKKQMSRIPELKEKVYSRFDNSRVADYIWEIAVAPQLGYAFSLNHSLPYSFVGIQTIYLAMNFNPIYWNTACLIVNSGATDEEIGGSTNYAKLAKAIGDIRSAGINVSLANINYSKFGFSPDVKNNRILFGLKGLLNVGDDLIQTIIAKRPYISPRDFLNRVKPNRQAMIALIKGGAFDDMMDRKTCMVWYIWESCDKKSRLTLQNMPTLKRFDLLPSENEEQVMARRVYEFNRYLKAACKISKTAEYYLLDTRSIDFLTEINKDSLIEERNGSFYLNVKSWDKVYQKWMDVFRNWITKDKESILQSLNEKIFLEDYVKYTKGNNNVSAWEMEVLCFYYNKHELNEVNTGKYGFTNFFKLPEEPEVDRVFHKGDKDITLYKIRKICGTCIAKDKIKSIVSLLTPYGVVNVKFAKDFFSLYDKQISQRQPDGTKKIMEKSWFNRGSMIVVQGIRSGDDFICKKYNSTSGHRLYKIDKILPNGDLELRNTRYQGDYEDEEV